MIFGKGGMDWLRTIDLYAEPIGLRADRNKKVGTPCGGFCSLIVLIVMLAITSIVCYLSLGNYTTTTVDTFLSSDHTTKKYEINQDKLLFAVQIRSVNAEVEYTIDHYFDTMFAYYIQEANGSITYRNHKLSPCTDLDLSKINFSEEQLDDLKYYKCIILDKDKQFIELEGFQSGGFVSENSIYGSFVMAPCASIADVTGSENCVSLDESQDVINDVYSQFMTYTLQADYTLTQQSIYQPNDYKIQIFGAGFLEQVALVTNIDLRVVQATFYTSLFSNFFNAQKETYYEPTNVRTEMYSKLVLSIHIRQDYVAAMYNIYLDQTTTKFTQTRISFFTLSAELGGLLTIIVGLGKTIQSPFAEFTVDNLLKRKLYFVKESDDPLYSTKNFPENPFCQVGEFYDFLRQFTSFYYPGFRWCKRAMCHWRCCCCAKCKDSAADYISDKASQRLDRELDIVQIIRQMRISAFNNQVTFRKQHQLDVIPFFSFYLIENRHTEMDIRACHPGQNIQEITPATFGSAEEEAKDEAELRSLRCKLRLIPTRDQLEQVNKAKFEKELEADLYKDDDPIDLTLLKNMMGVYYNPETFEALYTEIVDPPYEKYGDPNWYLHNDPQQNTSVQDAEQKEQPLI